MRQFFRVGCAGTFAETAISAIAEVMSADRSLVHLARSPRLTLALTGPPTDGAQGNEATHRRVRLHAGLGVAGRTMRCNAK